MKLLNKLTELIYESQDTYYGSFNHDGVKFKIYGSEHSHETTSSSAESGRYNVEDLSQIIKDFSDLYGELSLDVVNDPKKTSILTFDNLLKVNFVTFVNPRGNKNINLRIHTSLKDKRKLNIKPENKVLIITKEGDTIIRESINMDVFTKIVRGDIIIYHN